MNEQEARRNAVVCTSAGVVLLIVNYLSIQFNGMAYGFLPFTGCIAILLGLLGYFEPDVYRYKDDWSQMPRRLKYMMICLVVCGLLVGYCMNKFVYGIWT